MKKQKFYKKVKNNAQNTKQNQDFSNVPKHQNPEDCKINKIQIKSIKKLILTTEQNTENTKRINPFALATNNNNSKVF